jgi:hypothetical protein
MGMPAWLMEMVAWIPLVLVLGATLVCFLYVQLSKRMLLLMFGFLGLALADLGFRGMILMMREGGNRDQFQTISLVLLVVRIASWGLIVGGLVAVFSDVRERVDLPPRNFTEGDGRKPWERE